MKLNGKSRVVGVMGCPVTHSRSPQMHNAALRAAGLNAVYVPFPVKAGNAKEALVGLRALGMVGSNVTIPFKEDVFPLMDHLTNEARVIGAVNTIRVEEDGTFTGHNTDCIGAIQAVEANGASVAGKTVLVIGAGGAGRGVAAGCAFAGAKKIIVVNRTASRAAAVVSEMKAKLAQPIEWIEGGLSGGHYDFEEIDVVFQTTSMGMKGNEEIPIDVERLRAGCHLLEAVYSPLETPILKAARKRGLPTTDGLEMLLAQGAASFEFWFGVSPDRAVMRAALLEEI